MPKGKWQQKVIEIWILLPKEYENDSLKFWMKTILKTQFKTRKIMEKAREMKRKRVVCTIVAMSE